MDSVVVVTDRAEMGDRLRRILRPFLPLRRMTPEEWLHGGCGPTRNRSFILDLPTADAVRDRIAIAHRWPHGFSGGLIVIVAEDVLPCLEPSPIINDILVEPFSDEEAVYRVRYLLWRRRMAATPEIINIGDLAIDTSSYEVSLAGTRLDLTFKEYELLRFLASNPDRVFTRDMLLSHVWGDDYYGGTRTVDVHIRRLRLKLGIEYDSIIGTVRNVGYRFVSPE